MVRERGVQEAAYVHVPGLRAKETGFRALGV